MQFISKETARAVIERALLRKSTEAYCVINYQDVCRGDMPNGPFSGYVICAGAQDALCVLNLPCVGLMDVLWACERFGHDFPLVEIIGDGRIGVEAGHDDSVRA